MAQRDSIATPRRILFLCTHNSSRSQMAEAFQRTLGGADYEAFSAGTRPGAINPLATRAMAEIGIVMSAATGYYAKGLDAFTGQQFDLVVTVCDSAAEECPFFSGGRRQEHWGFPDPSASVGSDEERLRVFREVRDAIRERIAAFISSEQAE